MKTNYKRIFLSTVAAAVLSLACSLSGKSQTGLTNLSFESWTAASSFFSAAPTGWYGFNISKQTTGAQAGSNYARLSSSGGNSGFMALGSISLMSQVNGAPYAQTPLTLNGFYKTSGMQSFDTVGVVS